MTATQGNSTALTLRQLNALIGRALAVPSLQNVWVVGELSDLRVSGGHAYMELVEKNADTGATLAKIRAIIWASTYQRLAAYFYTSTGGRLASGMKVLVRGSVNYHAAYGMSFVITDIDPGYTMGEAERLRREILQRLQREGILELNRRLEWPDVPQRVAVISAQGAAGYGDFLNQLYNNPRHLRFTVRLFPALLQGDRTAATVIDALNRIYAEEEMWDCVVIIRGGGATSELAAFDNYELAANIAQFPLPVIVGIGHERDVTVLDYVANMRVKTPTAAAEWLISRGEAALEHLRRISTDLLAAARSRISGSTEQLAYFEGVLPIASTQVVGLAAGKLTRLAGALTTTAVGRIAPAMARLDSYANTLRTATAGATSRASERLASLERLVDTLSPQATLRRGYSIVKVDGHTVSSVNDIKEGQQFEAVMADGSFIAKRQ